MAGPSIVVPYPIAPLMPPYSPKVNAEIQFWSSEVGLFALGVYSIGVAHLAVTHGDVFTAFVGWGVGVTVFYITYQRAYDHLYPPIPMAPNAPPVDDPNDLGNGFTLDRQYMEYQNPPVMYAGLEVSIYGSSGKSRSTMTDEEIQAAARAAFHVGAGWGGVSFTNEGGIATIDSAGKISWSGFGLGNIEGAQAQFASGKDALAALAALFGIRDNDAPGTPGLTGAPPSPPDTPGPDDGQM